MTATHPTLPPTPGQTVGPFFHDALPYPGGPDLVPPGHDQALRLRGLVTDGAGTPVTDALVELWQAAPDGSVPQEQGSLRRDGWTFTGWGRSATDGSGLYTFTTVAPGPTRPGGAPFFALAVLTRGLTDRLLTRAYLPTADGGAPDDPFLAAVPRERRRTLVAAAEPTGFRFDLRLQGHDETVFLDLRRDARDAPA